MRAKGLLLKLSRRFRPPGNAVVRDLCVRDIGTGGRRHVAECAVWLIGVVFGRKMGSVACQALFAVIGDTLFGGRFVVRIVATRARHGVERFPLAHALSQSLNLADSA